MYTLAMVFLQVKYTSSPLDFQFSQVACFAQWDACKHDISKSLKHACMMRPACLYLGQVCERSTPRTTIWSEDERHVEQTWNPPTA